MTQHMVFYGNPGTGKTTVARMIAKIYHHLGLLSKGHFVEVNRSGLEAGYVGHTALKVKDVVKQATCTEEGVNTYTCKVCKDTYTEPVAKVEHKYNATVTKEATCSATGEKTHKCELCGDTYTESVAKKDHSYSVTSSTPATCTANGTSTYTCSVCGDTYTGTGAAATGHSYSVTSHTDSTCQAAGSDVYTCSGCGDSYSDTLALAAHTLGGWTTDAVVAGSRTTNYKWDDHFKYCSVCHAQVDRHAHSVLSGGQTCGTCGVQMPVY